MTDSRDRISGPTPADSPDDPDSQTFFEDEPGAASTRRPDNLRGDASGDASIDGLPTDAGYTGGLATGVGSAAGMRGLIADEQAGEDGGETDANLAQQDQ